MSKQVLGATALALLIGVSTFSLNTAIAENGGDARSNDRAQQKKLDDRELTPIRPIRRVGEDNWPTAKDQPATRETTGQSAKEDTQEKKQEKKKEDTAQNTPKPDTKQNPSLGNQAPPPDKPQDTAQKNTQPKQDTAKQDAPKPDSAKQDTAKQDTAKSDAKPDANAAAKPQDTAKDTTKDVAKGADQDKTGDQKNSKGFASIRLGTDENGRVAVNEAQERQVAKAIRRQHVDTVNVKVSVGSVAPSNVRLVAISSDMVDTFPQFRGYSFFATREEVVIVEPSSKKVVALIPTSNTATASRPSEERTTRTETRQPESTTSRTVARPRDTVGRSARFDDVPSREEILGAPVTRGPSGTTVTRTYRNYRNYEPDDDDVVVIERRRPRFFGFW